MAGMLLTTLAACDATPQHVRREFRERRLRDLGMAQVDPSGSSTAAGMSVLRDLALPALNPRDLGRDTLSQGFQRYVHRCGTCHEAPDPSARSAKEWGLLLPRMERHIREAGLLPLGWRDRNLLMQFLTRHAGSGP